MSAQSEPPVLHSFKNHVTAIIGLCNLALASDLQGELRDDLVEIHRSATAMLELLPQLVEESGRATTLDRGHRGAGL